MKRLFTLLLAGLLSFPLAALADHHDDYRDRYSHHKHKEKFRDGPCKVERKYKKNGDYEEKRKCRGRDYRQDYYSDSRALPGGDLGGIVQLLQNL